MKTTNDTTTITANNNNNNTKTITANKSMSFDPSAINLVPLLEPN